MEWWNRCIVIIIRVQDSTWISGEAVNGESQWVGLGSSLLFTATVSFPQWGCGGEMQKLEEAWQYCLLCSLQWCGTLSYILNNFVKYMDNVYVPFSECDVKINLKLCLKNVSSQISDITELKKSIRSKTNLLATFKYTTHNTFIIMCGDGYVIDFTAIYSQYIQISNHCAVYPKLIKCTMSIISQLLKINKQT